MENDGVAVVDEEGTGSRKITLVNVSEGIVEKFIGAGGTGKSRDLEDKGGTLVGVSSRERHHRHIDRGRSSHGDSGGGWMVFVGVHMLKALTAAR